MPPRDPQQPPQGDITITTAGVEKLLKNLDPSKAGGPDELSPRDVFCDPQRSPCGHSFCRKCITVWLQNSRTCPEDRKPLQTSQLHHDFILENIIGDQMVACPHRSLGCEVIIQLHLLSSHVKACDFNPSNQPEFVRQRVLSTLDNVPEVPDSPTASDSEDAVPSLGKPPLFMRLYKSDGVKKEMLKAMFDRKT
ncbi:hypothetical protein ACOMHN_061218 [Nucella lapillus]